MGQVGARAASPMTLLREYTAALRALLHGQTVTTAGRYVQLQAVGLDYPPEPAPPLLVGAVGPKTLELASELGDGVILTGSTSVEALRAAGPHLAAGRARAAQDSAPLVIVFVEVQGEPAAAEVSARVADYAAAGATHVILHSVGERRPPLEDFARFVASEIVPAAR
jgi:alkanesulfonate monooxygenase SsuD/methylene tetrahydromethanopterin reductase-like flavin-dependent oxidoreductase (luciferase family)